MVNVNVDYSRFRKYETSVCDWATCIHTHRSLVNPKAIGNPSYSVNPRGLILKLY